MRHRGTGTSPSRLAREATGRTAVAPRAGEGSRAGLMLDPVFAPFKGRHGGAIQRIWNALAMRGNRRNVRLPGFRYRISRHVRCAKKIREA
jgi:hypothetical protein